MDTAIAKQLIDKIYEKRKAAALDLEKQIRECQQQGDQRRISQIIDQLVDMFNNTSNALHVRNGGLIGLAGTAIALGVDVAPYMDKFVHPLLDCFVDPENRIRYFSAECLYNIAKVSKGEVLVYFNEIFDALSKLAADSELSVKNGAELLDRLLKDIVAESASVYIPLYPETEKVRDEVQGVLVPYPDASGSDPFTRSYLVSWINVLDSVPELELISYLPEFLDGLLKYLSDPTEDVRVATETLLADFVREIRDVSTVRKRAEEQAKSKADSSSVRHSDFGGDDRLGDFSVDHSERSAFIADNDDHSAYDDESALKDDAPTDVDYRDTGAWVPGQGVKIDYDAIIEILIQQLDGEHDEIQQSTALRWLAEFLNFTSEVMVPFTPRLVPAILPNLAHHVTMIQSAAIQTNKLLLNVIQALPSPAEPPSRPVTAPRLPGSPTPTSSTSRQSTTGKDSSRDISSRPHSPMSFSSQTQNSINIPFTAAPEEAADLFDYQATVNELTIQFLSEFEETRVAALKWLIMLASEGAQEGADPRILAMDDGTFPALLKTLSDSSEEVIKHDLQLLAQISSTSEENYFKAFMNNLLELFSTDRRLLETRGSLIIRQLCLNLNTERIYRTVIVQKLNIILITSPELADFRKRLKSLETRQDGQALFTTLYRSWCHNAAYEHASNLLSIFADLEITVPMLVQVDKLVQLIESPLLEPERYPYLFKCLYGLLMLLPQSSAFVSLRNRLNAVNSAGFLHIAPRS
ncbi:armadillo-type protein, partial [Mycena olivaceomarginata]